MIVLLLTFFVGIVLTFVGILLFTYSFQQGDYDTLDSLSLLPLQEEEHEAGQDHL